MRQSHISVVALLVALAWLAPSPGEGAPPHRPNAVNAAATGADTVNINTADVKELMTLEGVGRRVADGRDMEVAAFHNGLNRFEHRRFHALLLILRIPGCTILKILRVGGDLQHGAG